MPSLPRNTNSSWCLSRSFSSPLTATVVKVKNGTYKGVGLGDTSPSTVEYGYANGLSTKIEVKYRK